MNAEDFTIYKDDDGNVVGGGFKVSSILLKKGRSLMYSGGLPSDKNQENKTVSSLFDNYAVPAGLLYQKKIGVDKKGNSMNNNLSDFVEKNENDLDKNSANMVDNDIYDELMKMIEVDETSRKGGKQKTKRERSNKKNQTKKIKQKK